MSGSETLYGRVDAVLVDGEGVAIDFVPSGAGKERFVQLFRFDEVLLSQSEGLRRSAMLSLAQRALTHGHQLQVAINLDTGGAFSLRISNPTAELAANDGLAPAPVHVEHPIVHPVEPVPDDATP